MFFWSKPTPSKESLEKQLESFDKALDMLSKRLDGGLITMEEFSKKCQEMGKKKKKVLEQLAKYN